MSKHLEQLFKNVHQVNPPAGLKFSILQRIDLEKSKMIKQKLFLSYLALASSVTLSIYATLTFGQTILHSEFWSLASLIFSDILVVAQNWQEFTYSLLETFPAVSLAIILIPFFALLSSFGFYADLINRNNNKLIHPLG